MKSSTRHNTVKVAVLAMFCALAYVVMVFGRIPLGFVDFLKYDPKDVIITIAGFIFGPLSALIVAFVVAFIEMFTVSSTGFIGLVMNVISSAAFACTASFIFKKKKNIVGVVLGVIAGVVMMTALMVLWNYLITPMYMHISRDIVAGMLIPTFLPFNLLKGGINAIIVLLLYKPVMTAVRAIGLF